MTSIAAENSSHPSPTSPTNNFIQQNIDWLNARANALIYITTLKYKKPNNDDLLKGIFAHNCCKLIRAELSPGKESLVIIVEHPIGSGKHVELVKYRGQVLQDQQQSKNMTSTYFFVTKRGTGSKWYSSLMTHGKVAITLTEELFIVGRTNEMTAIGNDDADEELDMLNSDSSEPAKQSTPQASKKRKSENLELPQAKRARTMPNLADVFAHSALLGLDELPASASDMRLYLLDVVIYMEDKRKKFIMPSVMYMRAFVEQEQEYQQLLNFCKSME